MKWYKRDPDAALVGMRQLTDEQYKAYNVILDLLYSRDGKVPDEVRFMCSHLNWDPRKWRRVRSELLALGKIQLEGNFLANYRATSELCMAQDRINTGRKLRQIQLEKQRADAGVDAGTTTATATEEKKTDTKKELVCVEGSTPIPKNWSPNEAGIGMSLVDLWELGKFTDHALETNRQCANWDAAWRRWKRTEWYGKGYKDGASTSVISAEDLEARRNAIRDVERRKNGGYYDEEVRTEVRRDT